MTPRKLVANDVSCNMLITPGLVQFVDEDVQHPAITASLYGGSLVAHGAIRFSLSRFTTDHDLDTALKILPGVIQRLRSVLLIG